MFSIFTPTSSSVSRPAARPEAPRKKKSSPRRPFTESKTKRQLDFASSNEEAVAGALAMLSSEELACLWALLDNIQASAFHTWLSAFKTHVLTNVKTPRGIPLRPKDLPECLRRPSRLTKREFIQKTGDAGLLMYFLGDQYNNVRQPTAERAIMMFQNTQVAPQDPVARRRRAPPAEVSSSEEEDEDTDEADSEEEEEEEDKSPRASAASEAKLVATEICRQGLESFRRTGARCILKKKDNKRCTKNEYKPGLGVCFTHLDKTLRLLGDGVSRK